MKKFNSMTLFAAFGLLIGTVGCGGAGSQSAVGYTPGSVIGAICPAGQYAGSNGSCTTDFSSACSMSGGFTWGPKTCVINGTSGWGFPLLTPDNSQSYSLPVMSVPAGTVISFTGNGGWNASSPNSRSYLGGFIKINWGTTSCYSNLVDLNGVQNGAQLPLNGNLPEGLLGTAGGEVFKVGSSLTNKTLASGGMIRLGFNIPMGSYVNNYSSYLCGGFSGQIVITVP